MNTHAPLTGSQPPKGHSSGRLLGWAAILTILIAVGVLAGLVPRQREQGALKTETLKLATPTVNVVRPKPGQSDSRLALPAEVKPWAEAGIYARANGYLKRRLVDIGSFVEAGQLLAEIDTPELNQDLERVRALQVQAEASRDLARATAARWAELIKTHSVSDQENAEKQTDFKYKTATAESASAEARRLEKLRQFARVTAPFAGTVTVRNVDVGDLIVSSGVKELFHLTDTRKLRVFVPVSQAMSGQIQQGQTAQMSLPETPGRVFTAKVIRTSGAIATDSRTLLVELELDNTNGDILAGSYATVRFSDGTGQAPLTLPSNAVRFRSDGPGVFVIQEDGAVALRKVRLGRDFGQQMEILDGVGAKDRVIINPPESLSDGVHVTIAESAPKAATEPSKP